jgi:predicted phage-related endonuclease
MKTNEELMAQILTLKMYEKTIDELKAKVEGIKDEFKSELAERKVEELVIGPHIVRNTSVMSSRFDTKKFKEDFGASAYAEYCKEVISKRFSIS